MSSIPKKCPSCSSPLLVTQLTCTSCGTGIVGQFQLNPFFQLSTESLRFLESFIRNRGNVKEMARSSGESYWTIRRQLEEIIAEMGFDPEKISEPGANPRRTILEQLSRGEIDVQEATRQLTKLGEQPG